MSCACQVFIVIVFVRIVQMAPWDPIQMAPWDPVQMAPWGPRPDPPGAQGSPSAPPRAQGSPWGPMEPCGPTLRAGAPALGLGLGSWIPDLVLLHFLHSCTEHTSSIGRSDRTECTCALVCCPLSACYWHPLCPLSVYTIGQLLSIVHCPLSIVRNDCPLSAVRAHYWRPYM